MNTLFLQPSDVLFFRDGRPMGGSLSGHGAAWPLPTVTNAAIHAALWRADFSGVHPHRRGRSADYKEQRDRKFGSLVTAGPFPVKLTDAAGKPLASPDWIFPRPLDADDTLSAVYRPLVDSSASSLPAPLLYSVAFTGAPEKASPGAWWPLSAWARYVSQKESAAQGGEAPSSTSDEAFADTEFSYGIGIDPETGTQDGARFYSAHYLRLKPSWRLGVFAAAQDKEFRDERGNTDLVAALFPNSGAETPIIIGGQQRVCTVRREHPNIIPLPGGLISGFRSAKTGGSNRRELKERWLVKWTLLTPAIFPEIKAGESKRGAVRQAHSGGWLPTWICPTTGDVLLQTIDAAERRRRRSLNYDGRGYESRPDISARLVAAITGKPIPVCGYAVPHGEAETNGGEKPMQLAVPAGSVYYFEAESAEAAVKLAAALNWHGGTEPGTNIQNRRSTLLGEKGFGLGVCSSWSFFKDIPPATCS